MMDEWREIRLGDVCLTNTDSYSAKDKWDFVNYLDTGNITSNRIDDIQYIDIRYEKLPSRAKRKVKYNSIIYSTVRPNQKHYGIIKSQPENFLVSTGFAVIEVNPSNVDADFLYFLLSSDEITETLHAIAEQSTSAYPAIKASDIENLKILLPKLSTQRKIASLLMVLDDKIATNTAINKNLESQAQAIFDDFTTTNICQSKPLSKIAVIKYGKGLPTKKLTASGYSVFGGNGIIGKYTTYMYETPQILVSCRGAASGNILTSYPKSFITNNSLILELNDYRYYSFIKQFLIENPLHSYATGSAQPQITIDNIKDVQIPYPNYDCIKAILERLDTIELLKYHNIVENQVLANLRDTLIPHLMSGEIDVSNIEI